MSWTCEDTAHRIAYVALLVSSFGFAAGVRDCDAANSGREPLLQQITSVTTDALGPPKLRLEKAESIVFVSKVDVTAAGTPTPGDEVYLFNRISGTFRRLTNTDSGNSNEPTRETDITHSGRPPYVAFISTGDFDPEVGNPENNPELFVVFTDSGTVRQITNTGAGVVNAEPYASDTGQCIVFRSNGDLSNNGGSDGSNPGAGYSNADGSEEVFQLRFDDTSLTQGVTTQVSSGPAGTSSSKPVIGGFWFTRQCRSTAYESDHDQLGNGSSGTHIYNYTLKSGLTEQLSKPGSSESRRPAISGASNFARGPFVVFESNADMLDNGVTGFEIFRHRIFRFEMIQFTSDPDPDLPRENLHPVISDGGGMIAFESTAELIDPNRGVRSGSAPPFNDDGNSEIFRMKGRRPIWQITRSENCKNTDPSLQDNGRGIAFLSTCDLIPGQNPNGIAQIFLYRDTKADDPDQFGCSVAAGCCNEANGCYQPLQGSQRRPENNRRLRSW